MAGRIVPGKRDNWGKKPSDPLLRQIYDDPDKAARLQMTITIGLIIFWTSVVLGLIIAFYFMIFD
ncbi:MAG: hypothetical protein R6V01_11115 [Thermoplasmatota archaeon]